jgi:P-type E1-E2 ATPase
MTSDAASPLQNEITALSRLIAVVAVGIGLIVFVVGQFVGLSTSVSMVFAIGIIIANVPEGLLPTVTLAMAMAARRMGKRNTLVRHLPSVETLGCASVICTDKTGTLTQNRMEIRSVYVDGVFVNPGAAETPAFAANHRRFLECCGCCHDLKSTQAKASITGGLAIRWSWRSYGWRPAHSVMRRCSPASMKSPSSPSASDW